MQDFKKDMKKKIFHVLEFQVALGATFWDSQLAPSKFNPWGASGQLLISNTVMETLCSLCLFFEGIFGPVHFTNAQIIQMYPED